MFLRDFIEESPESPNEKCSRCSFDKEHKGKIRPAINIIHTCGDNERVGIHTKHKVKPKKEPFNLQM
jgi:hypothetical protein